VAKEECIVSNQLSLHHLSLMFTSFKIMMVKVKSVSVALVHVSDLTHCCDQKESHASTKIRCHYEVKWVSTFPIRHFHVSIPVLP